jgi:hypothetical protein
MAKLIKKIDSLDYKIDFNDICMREMGYDITEDGKLFHTDDNEIINIKEKFIIYSEDLQPNLRSNEIDLNLIENSRLMETLFGVYITKYCQRKGWTLNGYSQSYIKGSKKGKFVITYKEQGDNEIKSFESDGFENESLRVFNMVCKLNHRAHLYDFNRFDVQIDKHW